MDWSNTLISFSGGGLVVYTLDWYRRKGNVYTEARVVFINYAKDLNKQNYIVNFDVVINLINTSSDPILLRGFNATFFYQGNQYKLKVADRLLEPTFFINGKNSEQYDFKFGFIEANTKIKYEELDGNVIVFTLQYRSRWKSHRIQFTNAEINFSKLSINNLEQ
jgi:hypothetical protein